MNATVTLRAATLDRRHRYQPADRRQPRGRPSAAAHDRGSRNERNAFHRGRRGRSDRRVRRARPSQQGCRRGAVAGRRRGHARAAHRLAIWSITWPPAPPSGASRRSVRSRTSPPGSSAWASRSCRTCGYPRRSPTTARPARCSGTAGSTPSCCRCEAASACDPERPAAVIQGSRSIAPRRPNIERLQLPSTRTRETEPAEAVLA